MPKISVIVPVYKAEKFLHRCVDSIIAQTFTDFELLLIDDGSPDRSGEICDEYAEKDSRVRVFHKENGGVSSARNLAIEQTKGEWLCFIDSDDYWDSNHFLQIIEGVCPEIDIVHFGYKKEYKNGKKRTFCCFVNNRNIDKSSFFQKGVFSSCSVSYFFRTSHIKQNNIKFNQNIRYSEDREFIIKSVLLSGKNILLLSNCDYVYTYNIFSATNSLREFEHCKDDLLVIESIYNLIREKGIGLSKLVNKFLSYLMLDSFILSICTVCKNKNMYISEARNALNEISNKYPEIDCGFARYKYFMKFPHLTSKYYNLRSFIRNLIRN